MCIFVNNRFLLGKNALLKQAARRGAVTCWILQLPAQVKLTFQFNHFNNSSLKTRISLRACMECNTIPRQKSQHLKFIVAYSSHTANYLCTRVPHLYKMCNQNLVPFPVFSLREGMTTNRSLQLLVRRDTTLKGNSSTFCRSSFLSKNYHFQVANAT